MAKRIMVTITVTAAPEEEFDGRDVDALKSHVEEMMARTDFMPFEGEKVEVTAGSAD